MGKPEASPWSASPRSWQLFKDATFLTGFLASVLSLRFQRGSSGNTLKAGLIRCLQGICAVPASLRAPARRERAAQHCSHRIQRPAWLPSDATTSKMSEHPREISVGMTNRCWGRTHARLKRLGLRSRLYSVETAPTVSPRQWAPADSLLRGWVGSLDFWLCFSSPTFLGSSVLSS